MLNKELRLGNWVDQPNTGRQQVSAIHNDIQISTTYGSIDKYCKPIPLTEKWLLDFGFIKHGNYFHISMLDIDYVFKHRGFKEDYTLYIEYTDSPQEVDEGKKYPVAFGVKYVHQLQNLYFALTGLELELENGQV